MTAGIFSGPHLGDEIEAAELRHLDVQKNDVRRESANQLEGFGAVGRFGGDDHPLLPAQQFPEIPPCVRFILNDKRSCDCLYHWHADR
jgi:hypothetical protein